MSTLYHGDCLDVLPTLDTDSIDAVVTDPPYHLSSIHRRWGRESMATTHPVYKRHTAGFMGKAWDGGDIAFRPETWAAVLRVLKPGAHLVAFGGTRTYHRLACAIEDAGFEVRDCLTWLYGSGFPKSLDVSKAIDKAAGVEREVTGTAPSRLPQAQAKGWGNPGVDLFRDEHRGTVDMPITAPATDAARTWQGWGTALKPAAELIVLARKPLSERNVAANVLRWGTGALNIDGTRIGTADDVPSVQATRASDYPQSYNGEGPGWGRTRGGKAGDVVSWQPTGGRWPANVVLDEEAAGLLDEQSGESRSRIGKPRGAAPGPGWGMSATGAEYDDLGGASRFFYTAKADSAERSAGMATRNTHPTVKPIDLMGWLIRLVTPPGGVVLDPFLGSGTTAIAAIGQGFDWVGIECEAEYVAIAEQRIGLGTVVVRSPRGEDRP